MKIEEFLKFDTAKLHRELTNILLIATEESNYHYCYCRQTNKCALCQLCSFLEDQKIDGLPPKKFLQKFYNDRVKFLIFSTRVGENKEHCLFTCEQHLKTVLLALEKNVCISPENDNTVSFEYSYKKEVYCKNCLKHYMRLLYFYFYFVEF